MATPMGWGTFGPKLFSSQFFARIPYPETSFADQTVIVTGSNTGLGLEAARHIVRLGASKVIIAVRTISKGEAAAADILKTTKATKNTIEVWQLDLSSYESIKAFSENAAKLERLDAVLQNAGVLTEKWNLIDGQESQIRINVLGATLLGLLLLPKLQESAEKFKTRGRLSFVGSDMQYVAHFKEANGAKNLLAALADEKKANMPDRYPTSKLLLLYAIREIAARSPVSAKSDVVINVMTPGACKSDIFRDDVPWYSWLGQMFFQHVVMASFARTTEVGGRTLVNAVEPDLGDDAHGAFLMDCKIAENGPNVENETGRDLARRVSTEVFAELEQIVPGVTRVLQ